jgi:hypothetical protein
MIKKVALSRETNKVLIKVLCCQHNITDFLNECVFNIELHLIHSYIIYTGKS